MGGSLFIYGLIVLRLFRSSHRDIYIDEEMLLNQIIGTGKTLPHETLRDLVPFVPLKKHEKHLRRSVVFGKVAGCSSMGVFFFFFDVF